MKTTKYLAALILCLGVSALAFAQGGAVQRDTKLAVSEPTQVGPILLDPGSYTLRVHDFKGGKVQVTVIRDSDQKTMGTATAMRARRNLDTNQQADNQTQFTYTSFNGHVAVDTWYYPGDEWGEQFLYGKETIAANTGDVTVTQTPAPTASTSTMAESRPPAPAPAPAMEERHEMTTTEAAPAPAPAPAPEARTLPKTASSTPLVGLLGALSLAAAAAVRFGRRDVA
jgi:LPXTG-motif cell wall-anchored protein